MPDGVTYQTLQGKMVSGLKRPLRKGIGEPYLLAAVPPSQQSAGPYSKTLLRSSLRSVSGPTRTARVSSMVISDDAVEANLCWNRPVPALSRSVILVTIHFRG